MGRLNVRSFINSNIDFVGTPRLLEFDAQLSREMVQSRKYHHFTPDDSQGEVAVERTNLLFWVKYWFFKFSNLLNDVKIFFFYTYALVHKKIGLL